MVNCPNLHALVVQACMLEIGTTPTLLHQAQQFGSIYGLGKKMRLFSAFQEDAQPTNRSTLIFRGPDLSQRLFEQGTRSDHTVLPLPIFDVDLLDSQAHFLSPRCDEHTFSVWFC